MSLLLRDIAGYLQTNGLGTVGTNIYIDRMLADPSDCLAVFSLASPAPDNELDTRYLTFEVWSRNQSTKTGSDVLDQVFSTLHRTHHITLGDYYIYLIQALDNIQNMDEDIAGRKLQKLTFEAIYRDTRTVS